MSTDICLSCYGADTQMNWVSLLLSHLGHQMGISAKLECLCPGLHLNSVTPYPLWKTKSHSERINRDFRNPVLGEVLPTVQSRFRSRQEQALAPSLGMDGQSKLQGQAGSQCQCHAQGSALSHQTSEVTVVSFDTAAGELIPGRASSGGSTSPGPGHE